MPAKKPFLARVRKAVWTKTSKTARNSRKKAAGKLSRIIQKEFEWGGVSGVHELIAKNPARAMRIADFLRKNSKRRILEPGEEKFLEIVNKDSAVRAKAGGIMTELKNALKKPGAAEALLKKGLNAQKLKENGFSLAFLQNYGYSLPQIINLGFGKEDLLSQDCGFSALHYRLAGISAKELVKQLGFTEENLKRRYFSPQEIENAFKKE